MLRGIGGPASTRARGALTLGAVVVALVVGLAPGATTAGDTTPLTLQAPVTTEAPTTTTTAPPQVAVPVPPPAALGELGPKAAFRALAAAMTRELPGRGPLPQDVELFAAQAEPGDPVAALAEAFVANRYAELIAHRQGFRAAGADPRCRLDLGGDLLEPAHRIPLVCDR